MKRQAVYVCVLLWDVFLWLLLLSGVVWLRVPGCGSRLAALWIFSILKWVSIHTWVVAFTDKPSPAPLRRFVAHLCLLLPLVSSIVACALCDIHLNGGRPDVLLRRVLPYFLPDLPYLLVAFGFLILGVAWRVIDMLSGQLYQTHFLKELGWLAVFSFGRGATFTWVQARVKKRVKGLLYRSLLRQDIHFFEDKENKPGSLASRLHLDVDKMARSVVLNCNLLRMKEQILDCQAETKRLASQSLGAIRVVRSCRAERYEEAEYTRELNHMADIKTRKSCHRAIYLLLRRGRSLVSSGRITIGDLLAFFLYQEPLSDSIHY
ncbi:hypothetical protein CRUP_023286 [Coryphaenoides rupestris]|nr:hypothetical protein CRUP_023286 [Coryphaenoides rupestris]